MNRTTMINILSAASQPNSDIDYDGDIITYEGKKYYVDLSREYVEFLSVVKKGE